MTRWKLLLGALAAAMACVASFALTTASASTLEECKKFTPPLPANFTTRVFEDSACTIENSNGEFAEEILPKNTKIEPTATTNFKLKSSPLGIENEIECTTMGGTATILTNEKGSFTGEGKTTFSKCTVLKPAGCKVKEPIETVQLKASSEDLAGEVMKTKYEPKEGTTFTTITYSECGLLNGGHNVQGVARSTTVTTESEEFNTGAGELTFAGATATLTGRLHFGTPATTTTIKRTTP